MSNQTLHSATRLPTPNPTSDEFMENPLWWNFYTDIVLARNWFSDLIELGIDVEDLAEFVDCVEKIKSAVDAVNNAAFASHGVFGGVLRSVHFPLSHKISSDLCRWAHQIIDVFEANKMVDKEFYDNSAQAIADLGWICLQLGEDGMGDNVTNRFFVYSSIPSDCE